jgi:metal-responsive CopG/Arc/MetJ family transcriptional regulator
MGMIEVITMQRITVTLPDELARQFSDTVDKGERSRFVADALTEALAKKERQKAFHALKAFQPFRVQENSVEVLRSIRNIPASLRNDP